MRRWLGLLGLVACGTTAPVAEAPDCSRIEVLELPPPVAEATGVWDDARRRLVFWGGDIGAPVQCQSQTAFTGETWAWYPDCDAFAQLDVAGPEARGRQALAHDLAGGRMIIHGGRTRPGTSGAYSQFDDTWALDLTTESWTRLSESGPGARVNHALGVSGDRLVLFGGNNSTDGASYAPLGDVWTMDLSTGQWDPWQTSNTPSARLFHGYAMSEDGGTFWIYGGTADFFGPFLGDLHALDVASGTWTELHSGADGLAPAPRFWPNLVHDAAGGRLLLWAGHDDTSLGNTSELWSFDLATNRWSALELGDILSGQANGFCDFPADFVTPNLASPERRHGGMAAWTGDTLRVFGGESDCGILNDVWSWTDNGGWLNESRSTAGEICERISAGSCETLCF